MKKALMSLVLFAGMVGGVYAAPIASTLHVERIIVITNGPMSSVSVSSHTFSKVYYDEATCKLAATAYGSEVQVQVGPYQLPVATKAKCEALVLQTPY